MEQNLTVPSENVCFVLAPSSHSFPTMPRLLLHSVRRRGAQHQEENPVSNKHQITSHHTQPAAKTGVRKVFPACSVYKALRWALRKRGKEKRANQRMPDSSCMGDESRIQNVPSLADVKSHKMAHYWDRKGARWSNKPHVGLKQNDKGWDCKRWHCNSLIFQLLLNLDFGRIIQIRKRRLTRKFHSWIIFSAALCVKLVLDNDIVYKDKATLGLTYFPHCTWGEGSEGEFEIRERSTMYN